MKTYSLLFLVLVAIVTMHCITDEVPEPTVKVFQPFTVDAPANITKFVGFDAAGKEFSLFLKPSSDSDFRICTLTVNPSLPFKSDNFTLHSGYMKLDDGKVKARYSSVVTVKTAKNSKIDTLFPFEETKYVMKTDPDITLDSHHIVIRD